MQLPRKLLKTFLGSAALALLLAGGPAWSAEPEKSQMDVAKPLAKSDAPNAYRILFIGDSITLHGTSAKLKAKLGWDHVAGMAASEEAKDYAHVFADQMQKAMPDRKVELYFHTYGGSGTVAQRLSAMDIVRPVEPHLVVIQLGEHEKDQAGLETLRADFTKLVTAFDGQAQKPVVICAGPWSPPPSPGKSSYDGWPGQVEKVMREVCEANKVAFVSVKELAEDPACRGWGENPGVQWHPNDKGHAGYAQKFFDVLQKSQPAVSSR